MPEATSNHTTVPSRRLFLSQAAGVAASGAVLSLATSPPAAAVVAPTGALASSWVDDPIFALIAHHRAEEQAYGEALAALDKIYEIGPEESRWAADDLVQQLCDSCHELEWALAEMVPTSIAGVAAVLRYANECEDQGEEWPDTDTIGSEGWHYQLRQTAARALETLLAADKPEAGLRQA